MRQPGRVAISLTFGRAGGDRLVFGPLTVRPDDRSPNGRVNFVAGPIELWVDGECKVRLVDRNGIEGLSLRHLREALSSLSQSGQGSAYFGDHDFYELVTLRAHGLGEVAVRANVPSADLWDVDLPDLHDRELDALVAAIDALESEFGDLTGYCEGCGVPPFTYRDS